MTVAASLEPGFDLGEQLLWASRFASLRGQPLLLLIVVRKHRDQAQSVEIALNEEAQGEDKALISAVQEAIKAAPDLRIEDPGEEAAATGDAEPTVPAEGIPVRLKLLYSGEDLSPAVFAEIRASKIELLVGARMELDPDSYDADVRRELFRHAPCELVFVRLRAQDGGACSSLLVPVGHGPHSREALRLARDLAAETSASVTAMRVNQDIGEDAEAVGEHLLDTLVRRAFGKEPHAFARQVVIDNNVQRAIAGACEQGQHDVVIVGASKLSRLGQRILGTMGGKLIRSLPQTTVIITRAANPLRSRLGRFFEASLQRLVPQMERESRIALMERVQPTSQIDFDYMALMTLSSVIASIGLVQSSAAVVIGAMLVAPLMTPILGVGIALVQGNPVFARMTLKSIALGFFVALTASAVVGFGSQIGPFDEPTPEMLSRGGPGLLDLFVAFASGVAAAYASSRPNLLAAIPGVAIAAALVPPIATAGLALSIGECQLAIGAILLFVINTFAIILSTQVSFWAVGLRNVKRESRQTARIGAGVVLGVVTLAVYLSIARPGQDVDDLLPRPGTLITAIKSKLEQAWEAGGEHDDDRFSLRRIDVSHDLAGYVVIVRVTGPGFVPRALSDDVRAIARAMLDKPVEVRVVTEYDAGEPGTGK